jgi:nucleoside-diphosphate-sugar epimerase
MRALVTGASGFVGSALCRSLADGGHAVVAVSRTPEAARARVGAREGVEFAEGGVGRPEQVAEAAKGCDAIFHAAGAPPVHVPARVLRWLHVAGTENVVRAARHAKVRRLVHISCAEVSLTGDDRMHWDEKRALPREPEGLFARTKLMAEEIALSSSDEHLGISAIRPALLWGPDDVDGMGRLAQELLSGTFALYDGGRNVLSTTHIDQLTDAAIKAASRECTRARAYYITDGEFMEARELYPRFAKALGLSLPRGSRSLALALLQAKLQRLLGDHGAALTRVLRRGKSALFDMSQAVADLDYSPCADFDGKMEALGAWIAAAGGAEALAKRCRPLPRAEDVDDQVKAAGGD